MKSGKGSFILIVFVVLIFVLGFLYFKSLDDDKKEKADRGLEESEQGINGPEIIAESEETEQADEKPVAVPEPEPLADELPEKASEAKGKQLEFEISIKEGYEHNLELTKGDTISWTNPDDIRKHIKCYEGNEKKLGYNFFTSYAYVKGDTISHTFNNTGEFICIASIYALKWRLNVSEDKARVTGETVRNTFSRMAESQRSPPLGILMLAAIACIWISYYFYKHHPAVFRHH